LGAHVVPGNAPFSYVGIRSRRYEMWESRVAPLSGVLFALFVLVGFAVDPNADFMPPEPEIVAHIQAGPLRVMTAAYLMILASGALTWFSGSGYKALRRLDDDNGRLAALALAGGVFAAALIAVGGAALIAAAERLWIADIIDPGAAAGLVDLSGIAIGNGAPIGLGVGIAAAGVVSMRTGSRHRWVGWGSVLLALGLVSPLGWALLVVGVVWVPVAAIWLYRTDTERVSLTAGGVG
jgi:MFS family permease